MVKATIWVCIYLFLPVWWRKKQTVLVCKFTYTDEKSNSFGSQIYLLYLMEEAMFFVCKFTCFQSDGKGNNSEYLTTDLATDK